MRIKDTTKYNLQISNPALANEWHLKKNGHLMPKNVKAFSHRKVWWKCPKGHEYDATVASRSSGTGCPACSGRIATHDNCLETVNPFLAKEWHLTKNGSLTPKDLKAGSHNKIWWRCSKGHEWAASISNRSKGRGCPECAGRKANAENCLKTLNSYLAKEWHPTKNGGLTPIDVTVGSGKKVWWRCSRGHEWEAAIYSRNNGIGCPNCHSQTSLLELKVFTEMKFLFHDAEHRKKIHGVECDVFLPSLNLAIEIDGVYFHKDKYEQDKVKTNVLKKENVDLIRIREKGLSKVSSHDILLKTTKIDFSLFRSLIQQILRLKPVDYDVRNRIQDYLTKYKLANNKEFIRIWNMLPSPFPELSLQTLNPSLAEEWHPTKNGSLTPIDVTAGSGKKVWWRCSRGHGWESTVSNRNNGNGCPECAGKITNDGNCLQTLNSSLAEEWHHRKNGSLTPKDVTVSSHKKVWWRCTKGHEWEALISNRNKGRGCPYCAGQKVNDENCLKTVNPSLAKEWHPKKNGSLTPIDVTAGSRKKVWWKCPMGHEWEASIADRNNGTGCPACYNRRRVRI